MGRGGGDIIGSGARTRRSPSSFVGSVELETVKGVMLRIDLHRAIDDGKQDAWDADLLEAHGSSGPAGYLKASYIPKARFDRRYPTAFHWAARESGEYFALREMLDQGVSEDATDRDTLVELLSASDRWQAADPRQRRASASVEELQEEWRMRMGRIAADSRDRYRRFWGFHMDRPFVEYILAYSGQNEFEKLYVDGRQLATSETEVADHRRMGVGRALYETAALWISTRGMDLHASGLQSPEAGASWTRFREEGLTRIAPDQGDGRVREVLDAERLLRARPELGVVARQVARIPIS